MTDHAKLDVLIAAAQHLREGLWHQPSWCSDENCKVGPPIAEGYAAVRTAALDWGEELLEAMPCYDSLHCGLERFKREHWVCPRCKTLASLRAMRGGGG